MDVEFKFDDDVPEGTPELQIKQARPYPASIVYGPPKILRVETARKPS